MRRLWALVLTATTGAALAVAPATAEATETGIAWRNCGDYGAECASLRVPLDWANPGGPRITLALSRLKAADPARRAGTLFVNPGGPGGAAVPLVRDAPAEFFPQELRDRFDIVGMDPRGVGESVPAIACEKPTLNPKISQFPRNRAEYDRLVAYNRDVGEGCRRATGPLIDHVDTISTARDVEAVRIALGVDKVTWLGLSYGTLLGATYAQLYPARVRAAVLDGAVDHTIGSRRMAADEARVTDDVFGKFAAWCDAEKSCAMHGRNVIAEYRALLERAAEKPIPSREFPDGATADQIGYGTYSALTEVPGRWKELAEAISGAVAPDPDAGIFARVKGNDAAYRVIACHDFPSDVRGFADFAAREREARRIAPVTGGYVEGWDVQAGCLGWPVRPANPWGPTPVRGTPPILVVGGEHDPATPHPWAVGLASQIAGAKLLTWNGIGHTGYFNDEAVQRREIAYLVGS
ncbi:alpha/beta hydrolase [Amycolatopsis sp. NPDC059021]|uniref:alpha/beta hydrolase n=1 Tax=Amycolatopsis sp. NPDC059021 TaxID=3346704 RepID=UPI00366CE7E8